MPLTPQSVYRPAIVLALGRMNGSATKQDVLGELESSLSRVFTADDRARLQSRPEDSWRNRASWERNSMKEEGLLRDDTPGLWTLSELGWTEYKRLVLGPVPAEDDGDARGLGGFKPKNSADYRAHISERQIVKSRAHESLVADFGGWAMDQGFDASTPHPRDLVLRRSGREWLVEAKVVYRGNATMAVRGALGQLFSYAHFLYSLSDRPVLVALFSESIGGAYVQFLEALSIRVVWANDGEWVGSPGALDDGLASSASLVPPLPRRRS